MTSFGNPFILAVIIVTIGFVVGALVGLAVGRATKSRPNTEPDRTAAGNSQPAHPDEIRFWHDLTDGKLHVQYHSEAVTEPGRFAGDDRRTMVAMARELIAWLGGVTDMPTRPPLLNVQPSGQAAPVQEEPLEAVSQEPVPVEELFPAQQSAAEQPSAPSRPSAAETVPAGPDSAMSAPTRAPSIQPVDTNAEARPKAGSIVMQIDEVLQEILEDSPLKARGIRLAEDPRRGVSVWVGMERYDGVDAVKDPDVRAVLKKAVKEWERRSDPSRH